MKKRILYILLLSFILADTGFSFIQFYTTPIDGDFAGGVVPAPDVQQVLNSPLGTDVFTHKQPYSNPNRFFSHYSFYTFFNTVPELLQKIFTPITSLYVSCALAKIIIQLMLLYLLAVCISGTFNMAKFEFMLSAALVTPFFQTNGYRSYMGIIDPCTTYLFFYALPCVLVLLYFLPLILKQYHLANLRFTYVHKLIWLLLAIPVSLSGPLNPGISLVISVLIVLLNVLNHQKNLTEQHYWKKALTLLASIVRSYGFYLIPISMLSLYSLYLGQYNSISLANPMPLNKLYALLPEGLFYQFFQNLGFPVLFLSLGLNFYILKQIPRTVERQKLLRSYTWIMLFALLYLLLLPLGGYRSYRPYVLRFDTIMPLTLSLIFLYGITTLYVLKNLQQQKKAWYIAWVIVVMFVFTNADKPQFDKNRNEKEGLKQIVISTDNVIVLKHNCTVFSWGNLVKPEDSELNAQLLYQLHITTSKKYYYNQ